ncbi:beta-ketoacyl-[acyl-carrier-protein] synthase family protein [Streptomyces olivaceoviridis]|uniref:hypothetical protein n=1 Tax=Streptomyces olivaceoviridis TaxID=1921 RepID=UPI0036FDD5E7
MRRPDRTCPPGRSPPASQAVLSGVGATGDARHPASPHPVGRGRRTRGAAGTGGRRPAPADTHHVTAHATSTPWNDRTESAVPHRIFRRPPTADRRPPTADRRPPPATATKSIRGHCLGAARAVEAAVRVLAPRHQAVHPTRRPRHARTRRFVRLALPPVGEVR